MAGVPYFVGSNAVTSGGGGVLFLNPSADVASGDLLYVGVLMNTATTVTVTDSQNQQYNLIASDTVNTTTQLYIFSPGSSVFLNHLTENIMVNYASNASVEGAIAVGDNNVNNIDKAVVAHGNSAAPTVSSGALSQQAEHCIAFIVDTNAGGVPAWNATFSGNVLQNVTAGATTRLSAAYATVNSIASVTAAGTITSANWAIGLITDAVFSPVTTTLLSDGLRGEPYSQTLESTGGGGSYTYALTAGAFPAGISMAAGIISGTPTVFGSFPVTIQVTDANGITNVTSQVITIADSAPSVAVSPTIANNLLSAADSDFESGSPTWVADVNAGAPATTFLTALAGNQCLVWASSNDGLTQLVTGFYNVLPNKPYIASGYIWPTGNVGNDCYIGIEWYTSGNVWIRTDLGSDLSSSPILWQGVNVATFSPQNAAKAKLIAQVTQSNKGDRNHLDLVSFIQTDTQVLIDFVNPPFGVSSAAGNDFFDVSPWVRLDQGIDISRGRQDSISEISAGTCFWQMQNDNGMFTRYNANSPIVVMGGAVRLQERVQVNICDEKGTWHTRFDGAVSQIDYTFENSGNVCLAVFHASDMLAELNRQNSLTCWTREQVLLNSPAFTWTLDDAPNASGTGSLCVESSGNNGPPLRLTSTDDTKVATAAFQDSTLGVEVLADAVIAGNPDGSQYWTAGSTSPSTNLRGLISGGVGPFTTPLPSVKFTPVLVAQGAQNLFVGNKGLQLSAVLPSPAPNTTAAGGTTSVSAISSGQDFSIECWFVMDPAISSGNSLNYGPYTILSLGATRTSVHTLVAAIFANTGGTPKVGVKTYSQPPAFFGRNFTAGSPSIVSSVTQNIGPETTALPHHMVITVQGDSAAPLLSLFIDGSLVGTFTLPKAQAYDTITIGGAFGGSGCFFGNVSLVSIYPYLMSVSAIQLNTQLGQYGMWESLTDDCIAQLAKYASIPSFWNNITGQHAGLSLTDYLDITGSNAYTAMTVYEQAERGLLYVDAAGRLNFHTRDWRMGYGAPDLALPPDTFDADMGLGVVDQFQVNQAQVTTSTLGSGATAVNLQSQAQYGTYLGQSQNLPLVTWSRAYGQHGLPAFTFWPEPNLVDYVAWDANSKADPWLLPSQVTIDLKTLNPNTLLGISDFYGVEIDNVITPSADDPLPTYFPNQNFSTEWFIEGINEHKTHSTHTIQFFTSPAEPQRAWKPGDPTYGALGTTTRLGISAADTAATPADGKSVSHDGGPPYWVSGFSTAPLNTNGSFESASSASFSEDYEEGTGGVTITAGNSNFQSVSGPPASGTFQFDATHIGHGTMASKIATGATSGTCFGHFHMDGSTSASQWWRGEYYFTANPSAQLNLLTVKDQSGNLLMVLHLSNAGILGADGASVSNVGVLPNAIPTNAMFRIEVEIVSGSATDGEIHIYRYDTVNALTPSACIHIIEINTGGGVPYDFQCGGFTNSLANVVAFWTDAQAVSDSAPLGPPSSEVLPWTAVNNAKISASTLWSSDGNQALLIAGDGITAAGGAESEIISTIVPGLSYTLSADLYSPAGWATGATIDIKWLNAGGTSIGDSLITTPLLPATKASVHVTDFAPPGAVQAQLFAEWSGTPLASVQLLVDNIHLVQNVVAGAALNNPSANGHDFLGANDLRVMTDTLTKLLEPPMTIVGAAGGSQQAITSGSLAQPQLFWDFLFADTAGAMGLIPGWPNWYVCLLPGFYEIDAHSVFERSSTLGGKAYQGWIVIAVDAAKGILNGTATPTLNLAYNEPVGEIMRRNANNVTNIVASPTQRVYLGLGDMVTLASEQDSGGSINTGNVLGGSHLSIRFVGYSRKDDRYNINSLISSGGTVAVPVVPTTGQVSYSNTHTYSYYGNTVGGARRNTDGVCYQNYASGFFSSTGSQKSQIAFDFNKIKTDLTGKTVTSVTLSCKNDHTWYGSGGKLQVGVVFDTLGASKWNPTTIANSLGDLQEQHFDEGENLTFTLKNSIIDYFVNGDGSGHFAKGLRTGGSSGSLDYYGYWHGGPAQWTLTVKYHS